jgi:hypothetical protein
MLDNTHRPLSKLRLRSPRITLQRLQDIVVSGYVPRDLNILRAEILNDHRVRSRMFILDFIPPNSVGAELGVFTGLFSSVLARERKISRVTFVDAWWEAFGDYFPDWGAYTDYGRIGTRKAYEVAKKRIYGSRLPNRVVEVGSVYDWLRSQPNRSLDWVYLDTGHAYEETKRDLELLDLKIADNGLIMGDDWQIERDNFHHGLFLGVTEFLRSYNFELILCGKCSQWILRRSLGERSTSPNTVERSS